MPASLSFKKSATENAANLSEVKIITLTGGDSEHTHEYTLDITGNDIKLKYRKLASDGDVVVDKNHPVTDLATALEALLTADSSTNGKSVLAKEVAEKPVVEAIFDAVDPTDNKKVAEVKLGSAFAKKDGGNIDQVPFATKVFDAQFAETDRDNPNKKVAEVKLGGTFAKKDGENIDQVPFATKVFDAQFAATDTSNPNKKVAEVKLGGTFATKTELETPGVARKILGAKDEKKSILVEELGKALERVADNANDKVYGRTGDEKIAKDFLAEKGLKPTPKELKDDPDFVSAVKVAVNAEEIREVMLQPFCKIPEGENEPMCCYDPHPTCLLGA